MTVKLIVSDLDGTLMSKDYLTISDRNRNAIRKATEQGIKFVIASGRTFSIMQDVIGQLEKVDYAIVSNGAGIIDVSTGKKIYNNGLQYKTLKKLASLIEKYGGGYEIYAEGESYMLKSSLDQFVNPELTDEFMAELKKAIHPIDTVEEINVAESEKKHLFLELKDFKDIEMTSSMPGNMEINGVGVHKGKALEALCDLLNIKDAEVMAFGDGGNDVEMLKWAKRSYAMANASYDAIEAANFKAKTNYEDGLAIEVEKILK